MQIRDRIKELRRVKASELAPNPKNWRRHPKAQLDALKGVLNEVGIADALIAYETEAGLRLIDGHLRDSLDPEQVWPVLVLDTDEAESDLLLATLDPLAAKAEAEARALDALLRDVSTGEAAVQAMLSELAEAEGVVPPDGAEAEAVPDIEGYDEPADALRVIIQCAGEDEVTALLAFLGLTKGQGVRYKFADTRAANVG